VDGTGVLVSAFPGHVHPTPAPEGLPPSASMLARLAAVQNVGNLVAGAAALAAVQYAVAALQVPLVAVCGHSGCGAMPTCSAATAPRPS
jgi:hypothetical protein